MTTESAAADSGGKAGARAKQVLLIFGDTISDSDGLLADLQASGFNLVRAATIDNAESVLRKSPVALAIAFPEAATAAVEQLVSVVGRTRRGTPVLALRNPHSGVPECWVELGIGVLRCPLLPDALTRSVEVVLGLKRATRMPRLGATKRT